MAKNVPRNFILFHTCLNERPNTKNSMLELGYSAHCRWCAYSCAVYRLLCIVKRNIKKWGKSWNVKTHFIPLPTFYFFCFPFNPKQTWSICEKRITLIIIFIRKQTSRREFVRCAIGLHLFVVSNVCHVFREKIAQKWWWLMQKVARRKYERADFEMNINYYLIRWAIMTTGKYATPRY